MTSVAGEGTVAAAGTPAPRPTDARLVYFSSASGYTHRFVTKLGLDPEDTARLPLMTREPTLLATRPFVLVVPTYGGGDGRGAVPKQVIKFLNVKANRDLIRGVIAAGNTNFFEAYGLAGDIIARKCQVPLMYRFELMGTPEDVTAVREGLERFWA
ncbi:class Ib ribonucleoside-diphosphate reductase assembly flavoprotein NrdI [Citricoccus sp. SGAir0253]|uniref:class Ib ribonucleoside-diphosphate reductase assembly flavoprotein NrdI n=1 Tax=Citricoccus sp. SGAir0253 TaxID=2567881 RepID=UPI0010CCEB9B|nr:class Ib ribonucleoside-diphosphate reductase assembly flavoprotein NrdI [Citricoccus sp. SGAir0253]QCU78195.1 class Ib ribonucleoside-diphosphate reductase assembly flavoprotein NrdI [Citricoccus sp. SGAir0253]